MRGDCAGLGSAGTRHGSGNGNGNGNGNDRAGLGIVGGARSFGVVKQPA